MGGGMGGTGLGREGAGQGGVGWDGVGWDAWDACDDDAETSRTTPIGIH